MNEGVFHSTKNGAILWGCLVSLLILASYICATMHVALHHKNDAGVIDSIDTADTTDTTGHMQMGESARLNIQEECDTLSTQANAESLRVGGTSRLSHQRVSSLYKVLSLLQELLDSLLYDLPLEECIEEVNPRWRDRVKEDERYDPILLKVDVYLFYARPFLTVMRPVAQVPLCFCRYFVKLVLKFLQRQVTNS